MAGLKDKPRNLDTTQDKDRMQFWRGEDPEGEPRQSGGPDARNQRISKTVRMRMRFSEYLRDQSHERTVKEGQRVSEADILDEMMTEYIQRHRKS